MARTQSRWRGSAGACETVAGKTATDLERQSRGRPFISYRCRESRISVRRLQDNEVVGAYDLDSGKLVWKQSYAAPYQMNPAATAHGKGPKSTPVVSGNRLYTVGISGILTCWDSASGKKLWDLDSHGSPLYGQASSPVVDRGTLIASVGPQSGGSLTGV